MNRLCKYLSSHARSYLPASFLSSLFSSSSLSSSSFSVPSSASHSSSFSVSSSHSSSSRTQSPVHIRSQRGFTLVELIVVITILAILSAIGFLVMSNYASTARDGKRISEIKDLASSARINVAQMKKLPIPTSDALTIYVDETGDLGGTGAFVGYQGFLNSALSQDFGYNVDNTLDPVDKTPYTYRVNQLRNKSQFLAFLENPRFQRTVTLVQVPSIHLLAPALSSHYLSPLTDLLGIDSVEALDVDTSLFASKYPYAIGDPLGILLDKTTRSPLQSGVSGINSLALDPGSDSLYTLVLDEGTTSAALSSGTLLSMRDGSLEEKIRLAQFTLSSDTGGTTPPPPDPEDPTCGLTQNEVDAIANIFEQVNGYRLDEIYGYPATATEWCEQVELNFYSQPVNTIALGGIMKLINLQSLTLEDTGLTNLPTTIGNLEQLTRLDVSDNDLAVLPESLGNLEQLTRLNVSDNDLAVLPESLGNLVNLTNLNVAWNANLSTLPDSIGDLTILEQMDFDGTDLGNLIGYYEGYSVDSTTTQANITTTGQEVHIITHDDDYIQIIVGAVPLPDPGSCGITGAEIVELNNYEFYSIGGEGAGDLLDLGGEDWCNVTSLDMSGKNLASIPSGALKLPNIEGLNISDNNFVAFPSEILAFTNLKLLRAYGNGFTSIPSSISNLTQLEELALAQNQLTSLPESIGDLMNLVRLEVGNNQITSLPTSIGDLISLQELFTENNLLTTFPTSIGSMGSLYQIYAPNNEISSLPTEIGNIANLEYLKLDNNQITSLPTSIGNLSNLVTLSVPGNLLSVFPEEIGNLDSLYTFKASNNQLATLPDNFSGLHDQLVELSLSGNPSLGNLNRNFSDVVYGMQTGTFAQSNITPTGKTITFHVPNANRYLDITVSP